MLAMRLQRTGRSGHAQFRVVVQDSRFTPTSGRVVAFLGTYNPHTKTTIVDKEKAEHYLGNGAQPSERLAMLLKKEGVKLPKWVNLPTKKEAVIKNTEKLRRNRGDEPKAEVTTEEPVVEEALESAVEIVEEAATEEVVEAVSEVKVEEVPVTEESAAQTETEVVTKK